MMVHVEVQYPCEPTTRRIAGEAPADSSPEEVADRIGIPAGCFLDGKLTTRKGIKFWLLVAFARSLK